MWHDSWKSITFCFLCACFIIIYFISSNTRPPFTAIYYMPYEEITSTLRCGARGTARLVFNWFPQLWFWVSRNQSTGMHIARYTNKSAFYLGHREICLSSAHVMQYYLTLTINPIYFRTPPLELITKPEMKTPANLVNGWPNPWHSTNRKVKAHSPLLISTPQVVKSIKSWLNEWNQRNRFHVVISFRT